MPIRQKLIFSICINLVLIPFWTALCGVLFFLVGGAPGKGELIPIVLFQLFFLTLLHRIWKSVPHRNQLLVFHIIGVAFFFLGTLLIAGAYWDSSWDGIYYHQLGILKLAAGWNPFNRVDDPRSLFGEPWWLILNMTKLTWHYQAEIFALTGQIELAKHLNLMWSLASGGIVYVTLRTCRNWNMGWATLVAVVMAANPIVTTQLLTFYVDGALSSLLLILLCGLLWFEQFPIPKTAVALSILLAMIANTKLTGGVYATILLIPLVGVLLWQRRYKPLALLGSGLAFATVLGVLLGFNPFITNFLQNQNPIKPLQDAVATPAYDPYRLQRPQNMREMSRWERFGASLWSRSNAEPPPLKFQTKVPFLISATELEAVAGLDCRVGGFGPWFGGAILLFLITLLASLIGLRSRALILGIVTVALLASVLINPEAWWARFVPQFWYLPFLPLVFGSPKDFRSLRVLRFATLVVLMINALLVGSSTLRAQMANSLEMDHAVRRLASLPGPLGIDFGPWVAAKNHLRSRGLEFIDITGDSQRSCSPLTRLGAANLKACPFGHY